MIRPPAPSRHPLPPLPNPLIGPNHLPSTVGLNTCATLWRNASPHAAPNLPARRSDVWAEQLVASAVGLHSLVGNGEDRNCTVRIAYCTSQKIHFVGERS
uniref:Uncharacterized protein n=1 Tax=Tetraselmis sp. GSL018 TaxID=582737 RepID=A0A061SLE2_9CHLO